MGRDLQIGIIVGLKCNSEIDYLPNACNVLDLNQVFQDEKGYKIKSATSYGVAQSKATGFTEIPKSMQPPFLPFS